ncbi:MAG: RecQ family ATP-dependent DNA helicase [Ardenticatenales bacterium]|nr:RecQ family ATP-dependent DNA helicase [Ardenticatenales bacterium]
MTDHALIAALQQHFGFDTFRPGQMDAMQPIMAGRDSLIVMPTGAGKSLCYQLPALLHEGTTLVISPLIALMKDQVDAMQANGIAATFINSSLDGAEQSARLSALARGQWKLCYVAPERLRNQGFRAAIAQATIGLLAVDEAHCISQWGHDFRPDYHAIGEFVAAVGRPPLVALTATATPQVQEDIERQLGLRHPYRQVTGFNRPNLRFDVRYTPGDTLKQQQLKDFLEEFPPDTCGVIYVGRRREAEEVASLVRTLCGRSAICYHGGLEPMARERAQDAWMRGQAAIVVATNAFGMGVDKPNVRFVVHYTLPGTLEAYYQEAGRAGRDGEAATCLILHDPKDSRLHEWFIENDAPSIEELRVLYSHLRDEGRRGGGRIMTTPALLAAVLDWRADNKVRFGMKLLEQVGLLQDMGERGGTGYWYVLEPQGRVDMQGPMAEVEQRRTLKRRLLNQMLDYAQTHECRRQYFLDYFGDPTPPIAEWCCDNCQRQTERVTLGVASSPEEKAVLSILDAVDHLDYGVGRTLLAKIVRGGRGNGMARYFEHPQYGILRHRSQDEIEKLIDELIRERYLRIESGRYPTLTLTPAGEQALAHRLGLPVTGVTAQPLPSVRHLSPERVTDTLIETRRLFDEGLTVEEIAASRNLASGTIFNHLAKLIEQGEVDVERVVTEEPRRQIEAAVTEVGSFYLSPIKARLPEEISYSEIRCVVAAMQRQGQQAAPAPAAAEQRVLLERLMAWRRQEAQRLNQPPYFILSNAVLHALSESQPRTPEALLQIPGIGPDKCQRFGEALLALLNEAGDESRTIKEIGLAS